jgi:ethanolamine utilization protein EutA (predicted chaperonin)
LSQKLETNRNLILSFYSKVYFVPVSTDNAIDLCNVNDATEEKSIDTGMKKRSDGRLHRG